MLRRGGNAIDAACAAAWALGVCEPAESGLGGQTTMLIRLADGRCMVVDGHSRAPAGLSRKCVKRAQQDYGLTATTIPSTPATLEFAQRRFGALAPAEAIAPAIELAENGYRITALQRRLIRWSVRFFAPGSPEAALLLGPGNAPPKVGEVFRQPMLAATLRRISDQGIGDFYTGQIARDIVAHMSERGGLVTAQDLADLNLPVIREPLFIEHASHRVVSVPPPGGGVQALLALRLLGGLWHAGETDAAWQLAVTQATFIAFRERERWPDHPQDVTPSLAKWLVGPERAAKLIADFHAGKMNDPVEDTSGESGNTTHLCVTDAAGNVVSLTQSIQSVFGSKTIHPRLGFFYNNYLSASPRTAHPYRLGPGSLPQSNAAPTIVLDGAGVPRLALGSAGSRRITTSIVRVLSAVLDRGQSLAAAVAAPRAHPLLSRTVWSERSLGSAATSLIAEKQGPVTLLSDLNYKLGAVQAVEIHPSNGFSGAADPRRDGAVVVT